MRIWDRYSQFFDPNRRARRRLGTAALYRGRTMPAALVAERGEGENLPAGRRPVLRWSTVATQRLGLTMGSENARLGGARAKASGRAFEQAIEYANALYERSGRAVIYRHHPTVDGWGRTLRVTGKGPADFSGVVRLSDQMSAAIAFDCKVVTDKASYSHATRDRHQIES